MDSGASLHMMSENELLVKIPREDLKNPSSSRPPTVRQSRRKKRQKTVMNVFVTMMLLADSPAVLSLGLSLMQDGKVIRCNLRNMSPNVAVC